MRQSSTDINRIRLHGRLGGRPTPSHSNHGVEFYQFPLRVMRLSGAEDCINVVTPQPLLTPLGELGADQELTVNGEVRTFNNRTGIGSRLVISTFARELIPETAEDDNRLELSGTLCKLPGLRATPMGRTICDLILAVNRRYGRSDYLPCIAWGSLAHRCGALQVGDPVRLSGRLQSRRYIKQLEHRAEERVAFEVSVMSLLQDEE